MQGTVRISYTMGKHGVTNVCLPEEIGGNGSHLQARLQGKDV